MLGFRTRSVEFSQESIIVDFVFGGSVHLPEVGIGVLTCQLSFLLNHYWSDLGCEVSADFVLVWRFLVLVGVVVLVFYNFIIISNLGVLVLVLVIIVLA